MMIIEKVLVFIFKKKKIFIMDILKIILKMVWEFFVFIVQKFLIN